MSSREKALWAGQGSFEYPHPLRPFWVFCGKVGTKLACVEVRRFAFAVIAVGMARIGVWRGPGSTEVSRSCAVPLQRASSPGIPIRARRLLPLF